MTPEVLLKLAIVLAGTVVLAGQCRKPGRCRAARRVLAPGGRVLVVAETYKGQTLGALIVVPMLMLRARYLTLDEHRELLAAAGFADVVIDHYALKGWMCAVARRPASPVEPN